MSSATIPVDVAVSVRAEAWRGVQPDVEALARRAVEHAIAAASRKDLDDVEVEVSVVLADDRLSTQLNTDHRSKAEPANVLSFPLMSAPAAGQSRLLLGDIVLAHETVEAEAREQGKSLADHAAHLIVHGALHLLEFDHQSSDQAEVMEALEVSILARMGIADPYHYPENAGDQPAADRRPVLERQ